MPSLVGWRPSLIGWRLSLERQESNRHMIPNLQYFAFEEALIQPTRPFLESGAKMILQLLVPSSEARSP